MSGSSDGLHSPRLPLHRSSRSLSFDDEQPSPEEATTPNGTAKGLLHTLTSQQSEATLNDLSVADRPKKPEPAKRSMIPIATSKLSLLTSDVSSSYEQSSNKKVMHVNHSICILLFVYVS